MLSSIQHTLVIILVKHTVVTGQVPVLPLASLPSTRLPGSRPRPGNFDNYETPSKLLQYIWCCKCGTQHANSPSLRYWTKVHLKAFLVQIAISGPSPSDHSRAAGPDQKILVQISRNCISENPELPTLTGHAQGCLYSHTNGLPGD